VCACGCGAIFTFTLFFFKLEDVNFYGLLLWEALEKLGDKEGFLSGRVDESLELLVEVCGWVVWVCA
jgi:hypothetical protein